MRASDALADAVARLKTAQIEDAPRDARILMCHALGIAPDRLILSLGEQITEAQMTVFRAAIAAREARQPVAQITGARLFWGRAFRVTRDVLDPRPETETLVDAALARPFGRVLDLGTGSGVILLTLLAERAEATGLGVDISAPALVVAQQNARAHGLDARAELRLSDWFDAVEGAFDLIVSNPPYIGADELPALAPEVRDWEPRCALVPAGCDGSGLAAYRLICSRAPAFLRPGGALIVEIGQSQGAAVRALFMDAGFADVALIKDLSGHDRVVTGQVPVG